MIKDFFLAFVPIFVAVDALGMLPVFMGLSHHMTSQEKIKLINRSTFIALVVAILFITVGSMVFEWLGITINDFLVAGGSILFIIAIRDVLSFSKREKIKIDHLGVVPLAVPLIAGPAVLTTSLILLSSFGFAPTLFSVIANILLCGVILRFSSTLSKILGEAGSVTLSKIFSLLLAAIAVMMVRRGVLAILTEWVISQNTP